MYIYVCVFMICIFICINFRLSGYISKLYLYLLFHTIFDIPDSKLNGAITGPIWGRQGQGGPYVGPMNFAIWDIMCNG